MGIVKTQQESNRSKAYHKSNKRLWIPLLNHIMRWSFNTVMKMGPTVLSSDHLVSVSRTEQNTLLFTILDLSTNLFFSEPQQPKLEEQPMQGMIMLSVMEYLFPSPSDFLVLRTSEYSWIFLQCYNALPVLCYLCVIVWSNSWHEGCYQT